MHVLNRVIATLLALALLLGGLLAVVEIVRAQFGGRHWLVPHERWGQALAEETLTAGVVRVVLVGLVLLGLLLLVLALRRGKPGSLRLPGRTGGVRVTASRKGIERTLATAARRADGVRGARVRAGRRAVRIKASTTIRSTEELRQPVTTAVTERLDQLGLGGVLRPRVTVSRESAR